MVKIPLDSLVIQLLNGLALSMLLFLLAVGLTLIFGMMEILNLAHGSFYMLGAYFALSLVQWTNNFIIALVIAAVFVGILGYLVHLLLSKFLSNRGHLEQVLFTFGLAYVVNDLVKLFWGTNIHYLDPPQFLQGSIVILGSMFPKYRLFVIVFVVILAILLWLMIEKTKIGAIVRAGVDDWEMVGGLGINVNLLFSLVFVLGAALAATSGVIASPILSIYAGMDFSMLIFSLIIVILGGMGTITGAFWASLAVGMSETFGRVFFPSLSMVLIFIITTIFLLARHSSLLPLVKKIALTTFSGARED